ncbi:hypothetical protein T02_7348 [Trichinella nativa]|uniref:Uncharacterized protein n=1 Tax=Trichinella nativa TaxID=6335 RepID=A0A0V1JBM7_9BILA|nr:hypothetical protein T02_7348 [Trichinella nativa]
MSLMAEMSLPRTEIFDKHFVEKIELGLLALFA